MTESAMEGSADARPWSLGRSLLLVAVALAAGLALQHALGERLAEIVARGQHDKLAARAELAAWIRGVITCACGLTAALGLVLVRACRRPGSALRFPPPGLLSLGARRAVTGPRAVALTRVGLCLGAALLVASLAAIALAWYVAAILAACRA